MLRRLIHEPLVHFMALGALLFLAYSMLDGPQADDGTRRIVVSEALIEKLERDFVDQWRRPPDSLEHAGLIEEYLREEVLYREARALGLDRNDTVVRQRLARKMEAFALLNAPLPAAPNEDELRAYFAERAGDFALPPQTSFAHVFFNPDLRGTNLSADALGALDELRASDSARPDTFGDAPPTRASYQNLTPREVARRFGSSFSEQVFELPVGSWQGPVTSGYGLHLVLVTARTPARTPAFEDVSLEVRRRLVDNQRVEHRSAVLAEIRRNYLVDITVRDQASRP